MTYMDPLGMEVFKKLKYSKIQLLMACTEAMRNGAALQPEML